MIRGLATCSRRPIHLMASCSVWRPAWRVWSPLVAAMVFALGCGGDGGGGSPTTPAPPATPAPPPAADPAAGLCERTPQVRDAILARLSATDCGAVTVAQLGALNEGLELESQGITSLQSGDFAGLGGLEWLNLRNNSLTALPVDLFDGLGHLGYLRLFSNRLSALPSGVFSGLPLRVLGLAENQLSSLPSGLFAGLPLLNLYLDGNPGAPFSLPLTLKAVAFPGTAATTELRVEFAYGAPFPMTVRLSATGAALSPSQVAIPLGGTQSEEFTLTPQGAAWSVVARADPPENESGYGGFFIAAASFEPPTYFAICGRTPQVRDALLELLSLTDCSAVADTQLESVSALDLGVRGIASLDAGDFTGLSGLKRLNLRGNALTTLPEGIFADLSGLEVLDLAGNSFDSIPEGVFTGPGNLERLFLQDNPGSPFHFPLAIEEISSSGTTAVLRVTIDPGAPIDITIALSAINARLSSSAVTIPAGGRTSRQFSVLPSAASWSLTAAGPELPSSSYAGFTITDAAFSPEPAGSSDGGICDRTPEVRDGILALLPINDCTAVTTVLLDELSGTLNLRNRGISTLKSEDFTGLTELRGLDLEHNRLSSLPTGVFDALGSLEELRLGDNSLRSLPSGVFDRLEGLRELGLSGNPLGTVPPSLFNNLDGLTTLGLSRISLRNAPRSVLTKFSLERLDLSGNRLSTLPTDLFAGQGLLEELNLSGNLFSELPSGVFDGLGDLETLYLEGNSLTTLPAGLFGDLDNLQGLSLQHNSLTTLPTGAFDGLGNLEGLQLYENSLSTLPAGVFRGLGSLQYLRLDDNSLTMLPAGVFDGLGNLSTLILYRNSLEKLPAGVFDGLGNLFQLRLFANSLTELPEDIFSGLGNLRWLFLGSNELRTLPEDLFDGLDLNWLFLDNNALDSLPERLFEGLPNLELLRLEGNPGAPFSLPLEIEEVSRSGGATTLRVEFAYGAPFPMTIPLTADRATLSSSSVTIPTGGLQSGEFTVDSTAASWSVKAAGPPLPSTGFGGQYRGFIITDAVFPPEE